MKYTISLILIVIFSFLFGCTPSEKLSRPLPDHEKNEKEKEKHEINRGNISVYPARMTEISSREKLLDLGDLLEASFIYEAISGTRQASFSNVYRNSFGLNLSARDFLIKSSEENTSDSTQMNSSSSFTRSTNGNNADDSNESNRSTNIDREEDSGSSSSSNQSSSLTKGFVDQPKNIYQYSTLASPESSGDKEVAFRELITAVANAQLGGRGLLRRMNLSPLASETHQMFMLPVDVNFNPGRYTSKNYRGHAKLELSLPDRMDSTSINIIAVAPMGYSQIVSEFSSALKELSANAFAGIGASGILMEGKLEGLIQQLSELDAIVSQPEFAVNISDSNRVEFDYFGTQDLSGSSKLKAQSFQVELLVLIGGNKDELTIEKLGITGSELIQKFENSSFNTGVAGFQESNLSPSFTYNWYFAPTKELKKRFFLTRKKSWKKHSHYGGKSDTEGKILMTQQFDDFSKIDLTKASIFRQVYDDTSKIYRGYFIFEGTGLNVHRKINELYTATKEDETSDSDYKDFVINKSLTNNSTSNQTPNPNNELSGFISTVTTTGGKIITNSLSHENAWISDKHVGFEFESQEQLRPGQKLNVLLQVREWIKDEENGEISDPQETIVLFKTLTISGKKIEQKETGITDLTAKAITLERGLVGIEISFNQKGVTASTFEVNGNKIENFLQEDIKDLKDAAGEAYQQVTKTLKINLSNDEQKVQEISNNKYYLVIKDNSIPKPKVLVSKLVEE